MADLTEIARATATSGTTYRLLSDGTLRIGSTIVAEVGTDRADEIDYLADVADEETRILAAELGL